MANNKNSAGLQIDINAWKQRLSDDLDLMLGSLERDASARLPKYADGVKTRIDNVRSLVSGFIAKAVNIRLSGSYTPQGEQDAINTAARTVSEQLDQLRKDTVDKLQTQQDEKLAAALQRAQSRDPLQALLNFMREQEIRDYFRDFEQTEAETYIRRVVAQGGGSDLVDAVANAPIEMTIRKEFIDEMKNTIAQRDHPELGELAQLQQIYTRLIGIARQSVLAASGGDAVALDTRVPLPDTRKPFTVSGVEVPEVQQ